MKTAIRFALALYPQWWRRRYGSEMDVLLEESGTGWGAAFDIAHAAFSVRVTDLGDRVRRVPNVTWLVLIPTLIGALTMVIVAMRTPSRYRSEAVVEMVAWNYLPKLPILEEKRLDLLKDRVMTQAQLEQVIQDLDLFHHERQQSIPMGRIIDAMRRDIELVIERLGDGQGIRASFRVRYVSSDPEMAMMGSNRLAALFTDESTRDRIELLESSRLQKREAVTVRLLVETEDAIIGARRRSPNGAEVAALRVKYGTLSAEYHALMADIARAKTSATIERRDIREYFTLRDAPRLPATAIGPNRILMIAAGAAVGLAIGLLLLAARVLGGSAGGWLPTPSTS